MSTTGVPTDFNTVQEIHLENPWWDKNIVDDMQINNKMSRVGFCVFDGTCEIEFHAHAFQA